MLRESMCFQSRRHTGKFVSHQKKNDHGTPGTGFTGAPTNGANLPRPGRRASIPPPNWVEGPTLFPTASLRSENQQDTASQETYDFLTFSFEPHLRTLAFPLMGGAPMKTVREAAETYPALRRGFGSQTLKKHQPLFYKSFASFANRRVRHKIHLSACFCCGQHNPSNIQPAEWACPGPSFRLSYFRRKSDAGRVPSGNRLATQG